MHDFIRANIRETVPDILLVLNQYRQIVYTNLTLVKVFGIDAPALIL